MAKETKNSKESENYPLEYVARDWSQVNPKKGLSHLEVDELDISHLPGLVDHWDGELKKRKKEILEWTDRTTMQKAMTYLGSNAMPKKVSGEVIAEYCSAVPVTKMVQALKKDPLDYKTRVQLVDFVVRKEQELPVEAYRELLLQVTVANLFNKYSVEGVQVALSAQTTYLKQLQGKCRHSERMWTMQATQHEKSNKNPAPKYNVEVVKPFLDRAVQLINRYLNHVMKGADGGKAAFTGIYKVPNLKDVLLNKNDAKQNVYSNIPPIVHRLRYHTLLSSAADELSELLIKVDKRKSLGYFLKGRLNMSALILGLCRYQEGENTAEDKKEIQRLFKEAFHYYEQAVKNAGGYYKGGSQELTMLLEYVNTLRYFIDTVAKVIRLKVPRGWVVDNLSRAKMLLKQTESDDQRVIHVLETLEEELKKYRG